MLVPPRQSAGNSSNNMNLAPEEEVRTRKLQEEAHRLREDLRQRLDRYLDLPLALASILLALLAIIDLSGEVAEPWQSRLSTLSWFLWGLFFVEFALKFALAPLKRAYLRRHWLDVLVVLVPFLRLLRVLRILRATRALWIFRLLVFGGQGSSAALVLLKRRRLGQLALVSVLVVLIGAATGFILEAGAPNSQIESFGDALWWSFTLGVGSEVAANPVTVGGRIVGFMLLLYAAGVSSYVIGSIASVLVGLDAQQQETPEAPAVEEGGGAQPSQSELEALRREIEALRRALERAKMATEDPVKPE